MTTTTYAQVGAFDYITNGENNACSLMRDSLGAVEWTVKPAGFQTRVTKHD